MCPPQETIAEEDCKLLILADNDLCFKYNVKDLVNNIKSSRNILQNYDGVLTKSVDLYYFLPLAEQILYCSASSNLISTVFVHVVCTVMTSVRGQHF